MHSWLGEDEELQLKAWLKARGGTLPNRSEVNQYIYQNFLKKSATQVRQKLYYVKRRTN